MQILQTHLHKFFEKKKLVERILVKIKAHPPRWSFYKFSHPFLVRCIILLLLGKKTDICQTWNLKGFKSLLTYSFSEWFYFRHFWFGGSSVERNSNTWVKVGTQ